MAQIYWNYERPVARHAAVAFDAGIAGVLADETAGIDVPVMELPEAGAAIDGVATHPIQAETVGDFATELNKYTPVRSGGTFGVGALLAVNGSGAFVTATPDTYIVAKAVQASTTSGQLVTVERVAPTLVPAAG